MTDQKHTPGPWAWHSAEQSLIGLAGVYIIRDGGSYEGLSINDFDRVTPEAATANMQIMAAAPELAAELSRMVEHFEAFARDHSDEATPETWAALHCAKAALAKAGAA